MAGVSKPRNKSYESLSKFYDYNMVEVICFLEKTVPKLKEPELDEKLGAEEEDRNPVILTSAQMFKDFI